MLAERHLCNSLFNGRRKLEHTFNHVIKQAKLSAKPFLRKGHEKGMKGGERYVQKILSRRDYHDNNFFWPWRRVNVNRHYSLLTKISWKRLLKKPETKGKIHAAMIFLKLQLKRQK
ncbi:MAG: hypothetical protein HZA01_01890 [Nitrospinae bacterium]|nr:hypothetical protein [Nitrospinota bacterium]